MAKGLFVKPEAVRVTVLEDEWVEFKRGLTYGEQQYVEGTMLTGLKGTPGGPADQKLEVGIDWERHPQVRLFVWLLDWSFKNDEDKPVKITRAAIAALNPEVGAALQVALDRHIEAMEEEKKALNGKNEKGKSAATSTSAAGRAGATPN